MKNDYQLMVMLYERVYGWKSQQMGDQGEVWKRADGGIEVAQSIMKPAAYGRLQAWLLEQGSGSAIEITRDQAKVQVNRGGTVQHVANVSLGRALTIATLLAHGVAMQELE